MSRIIKSYRSSLLYLCNTSLVSQRAPRRNWPRVYGFQGHRSIPIQWITPPEHVIRTAWVRFNSMGPLSELAIPLEHVIRTAWVRFNSMGPLSELAIPLEHVIRTTRIHFNSMGPLSELASVFSCVRGYPNVWCVGSAVSIKVIPFLTL